MAGRTIFQRGQEYYTARMVRSVTWEGDALRAEVAGSRRRPYTVTAGLGGSVPVVRCTCPYDLGGLCKHGVAVLLYLIDHDTKDSVEGVNAALLARGQRPAVARDPAKVRAKAGGPDAALKDFLHTAYDAPRLQLMLPVKGLRTPSGRGIPFSLGVVHQGRLHKIADMDAFLAPKRHIFNEQLPSITMFSDGQDYFLKLVRGFLASMAGGGALRSWRLQPFQLSALLDTVCQETGIDLIDAESGRAFVLVQEPPVGLRLLIRAVGNGSMGVTAHLVPAAPSDAPVLLKDIFSGSRCWLLEEASLAFHLVDPRIDRRLLEHFLNQEQVLSATERQHFLAGILPGLKAFADIVMDDPGVHAVRVENMAPRACYAVDVERDGLAITLAFDYAGQRVEHAPGRREFFVEQSTGGACILLRRDPGREDACAEELVKQYACVPGPRPDRFGVTGAEAVFDFLSKHVPVLARDGDVYLSSKAKALYRGGEALRPRVRLTATGIDWFACDIVCTGVDGDVAIPLEALRDHAAFGRNFVRLKTGEYVTLDAAAFSRIADLLEGRDNKGRLMLAHLPYLIDELEAGGVAVDADTTTRKLCADLRNFTGIEAPVIPASVEGVLRDYQRHGVSWMAFLKKFRCGGILADEMGLGKTLQALTMIQQDVDAGCARPSLIVCPTTLVWNWEAEIRKFLPGLKLLVITGQDRSSALEEIPGARVVITSYALLRRDIEQYHQHDFHYVILDEAQNIKNRYTINARVTKQLNSSHRLALTGTPLENSVADIWSIFDFLMPSFLGKYENFRSSYEMPITQEGDAGKLRELSRRIAPFVLRRLKKDVIRELPEKIEQVSFCELSPAQARVYAAMAQKARREASAAYQAKGFERSRMLILTLLLRLRQICCHPELAGIRSKHRIGVSAKTDLLKETLRELTVSGHRVLVFSQFVGMLDIIRDHLNQEKVVYEYMTGQTKDRQACVARFNDDPSVKVFLLSLKVGGLGLNLTAADTVILYEPWWNPAVEQQAIDRTHRIGQKNAVLAYHLIARGTIEEKMLELQKRKKFLMSALVLSEENIAKKLDWEDIKFLLDFEEAER